MAASMFSRILFASMFSGCHMLLTNTDRTSAIDPTGDTISPSGNVDELVELKFLTSTHYGRVRGLQRSTAYGEIIQFLGIPYAKPPTGSLRFQPPAPPDRWTGDRDAFSFASPCLQGIMSIYLGSEDCLYLNVYVPTKADISSELLSVMVWIHGGGYEVGTSSIYDGSGLASQGVIVVTINYRLDVFGFLSTEDDVIPGNYGMLDQVMALKWVQQNIAFFGGDPAKVTILGESAGASSVSLHLLSPLTKGLFHRAIMQSGSSLCPWAITHPATRSKPKLVARLIGGRVGCPYSNSKDFLSCLQGRDAHILHKANREIQSKIDSNNFVMKPRVENIFGFLPGLPIKLLAAGKFKPLNTIQGFTADETGFTLGYPNFESINVEGFQKAILGTLAPYLYGCLKSFAIPDKDEFVREAMRIYNVSSTSNTSFIRDQTIQVTSNLGFVGPVVNEINLLSSRSPRTALNTDHFLYQFKYRPDFSIHPSWIRLSHAEELPFVFGVDSLRKYINITEADTAMSSTVLTMWSNFAKTGNPNSSNSTANNNSAIYWKPFTRSNHFIMELDSNLAANTYNKSQIVNLSLQLITKIDTSQDLGDRWIVG